MDSMYLCLLIAVAALSALVPATQAGPTRLDSRGSLDSLGGGHVLRQLDPLGGGHVLRALDPLGGGHVLRDHSHVTSAKNFWVFWTLPPCHCYTRTTYQCYSLLLGYLPSLPPPSADIICERFLRGLDSLGGGHILREVEGGEPVRPGAFRYQTKRGLDPLR